MISERLISDDIIPLQTSDLGNEALDMMTDFCVRHLPIVNNEQLLGVLSEDDILDHDVTAPIGSYALSLPRPFVNVENHLYDVMKVMAENGLTLVPVIDEDSNYLGAITLPDLLGHFSKTSSFTEKGSVIVLEIPRRDYLLSQVVQIVESENAYILSLYVTSVPESPLLEVTLKVNRSEISNILSAFDRFDYSVKATFNELKYMDGLKDRYDALMHYLNV